MHNSVQYGGSMSNHFNLPEDNEKGFVFIVCILLLFVLTIAGITTVRTSGTEALTVRNQGQVIRELYDAETGLIDSFENPQWLKDDAFLIADPGEASSPAMGLPPYQTIIDGHLVATYKVRCIEALGTDTPGMTDFENDGPAMAHKGPPPVGSGYSVDDFEIRRYAMTAHSATGNTVVQGGVWKVFNKF